MRIKPVILILLLLFIVELTACAEPVYADGTAIPQQDLPRPPRDLGASIEKVAGSSWDLFGSVGETVLELGQVSPNCVGVFSCLLLPLAILGLWTLSHLKAILGMATLRENIRSFVRD